MAFFFDWNPKVEWMYYVTENNLFKPEIAGGRGVGMPTAGKPWRWPWFEGSCVKAALQGKEVPQTVCRSYLMLLEPPSAVMLFQCSQWGTAVSFAGGIITVFSHSHWFQLWWCLFYSSWMLIKCVCTYINVKGIIFQSQSCLLGQKTSLFWDMLSTSEWVLGPCATQIPSNVNILGFSRDIFLVFSCVG